MICRFIFTCKLEPLAFYEAPSFSSVTVVNVGKVNSVLCVHMIKFDFLFVKRPSLGHASSFNLAACVAPPVAKNAATMSFTTQ